MESLRTFFRITLLPLVRFLYRLRVRGADRVPTAGGALLISNHVSYLDSFIIYAACPRPVRFVIVSRYLGVGAIRWFLNLFGAIPITPGRSRDAIRATVDCLKNGDVVCIFPEGQLTRTGLMNELKKGFELIARQSGAPVVPVYIHGLWGSIFSFERGRFIRKWPHTLPWPVVVAFGAPRPADAADVAWAGDALRAAAVEAFLAMPQLERPLAAAIVHGLKTKRRSPCLIEHGKSMRRLRRHQVLATAIALSRHWSETLSNETRIGIFLPGGTAPALLNLGLILAGRVPVNLPFPEKPSGTLDVSAAAEAIRSSGVRTVITARAFADPLGKAEIDRLRLLDVTAELASVGIGRLFFEKLRAIFEPAWLTCRRLELPAASTWETVDQNQPREWDGGTIVAEALRLSSGHWTERGETFFCEFGLHSLAEALWTLWMPVLHVHSVAGRSFSARTDPALIETVCGAERARRLVLSPDSLGEVEATGDDPWHPEIRAALRSVLVPVGAISDATGLHRRSDRVASKTGAPICPYWAPGGGGIVAISQPAADPDPLPKTLEPQPGGKMESPGKLLPGLEKPAGVQLDETGFVLKGVN